MRALHHPPNMGRLHISSAVPACRRQCWAVVLELDAAIEVFGTGMSKEQGVQLQALQFEIPSEMQLANGRETIQPVQDW